MAAETVNKRSLDHNVQFAQELLAMLQSEAKKPLPNWDRVSSLRNRLNDALGNALSAIAGMERDAALKR